MHIMRLDEWHKLPMIQIRLSDHKQRWMSGMVSLFMRTQLGENNQIAVNLSAKGLIREGKNVIKLASLVSMKSGN